IQEAVRNNDRLLHTDVALAAELWQKIHSFLPQELGGRKFWGMNEVFRFYRYCPGQKFALHQDGKIFKDQQTVSLLTFLIYLNEGFAAGETAFREHIIQPEQGMALVFSDHLLHEGKPLIKGIKYVLRSDVFYQET
ncbi:MAG: 2OG-Fe(II) oxygenase, partial [Bacteroidota bacterium]